MKETEGKTPEEREGKRLSKSNRKGKERRQLYLHTSSGLCLPACPAATKDGVPDGNQVEVR